MSKYIYPSCGDANEQIKGLLIIDRVYCEEAFSTTPIDLKQSKIEKEEVKDE